MPRDDQKPVPTHLMATADQVWAALDDLIRDVRGHRREDCVSLAVPCIDPVLDQLVGMSRGRLVLMLGAALCRLADQTETATQTIEGIST